jgi:Fe-S-cluster-containing dehydrogenase component
MACPYGIPSFGSDGKMIKCDGCYVRLHRGMKPACVKACPVGALKLVELAEVDQICEKNSLKKMSIGILKAQV